LSFTYKNIVYAIIVVFIFNVKDYSPTVMGRGLGTKEKKLGSNSTFNQRAKPRFKRAPDWWRRQVVVSEAAGD
jgi:hypothetical protein